MCSSDLFSSYVMITSWENDDFRKKFIDENKLFQEIITKSSKRIEIKIDPYNYVGSWNGINPFKNKSSYKEGKIIVLTRARVRLNKLINFFISTSYASKSINSRKGAEYYKGVGEDTHQQEIDAINSSHAEEIAQRDEALDKYQEIIAKIEKKYEESG